jgi:hypothetical protein
MSKLSLAVLVAFPLLTAGVALADSQIPDRDHHPDRVAMHKDMCADQQAREAGRLAFLEAKLDLTDAQKPLFTKWRQALLESAGKQKAACLAAAPKTELAPTIVEHEAHNEAMLSARLASLQSSRPALQSLYDSLSPAQRQILDRPAHHGHGGGPGGPDHLEMMHGGAPMPRMPAGQ